MGPRVLYTQFLILYRTIQFEFKGQGHKDAHCTINIVDDHPARRSVSFHSPLFYRHHHHYYYYSDARTDTARVLYTNARAHGLPRFCVTYTANNGPKHPSFYILISEHDLKLNTIYRTGVVLYEDETLGEYTRTHTHAAGIDNDLTFDRFRFLRFHST